MSYTTTTLGQQLAVPGTGQAFETPVVNGNSLALEEAILADRTRLDDLEEDLPGFQVPAGTISAFAGMAAPAGWSLCDGGTLSRTAAAALFAVIGSTYGGGDGSTTFTKPDLKGRVPVGLDAAQTEFDTLGEVGGAKTHTHALTSAIAAWFSGVYKNRVGPNWVATNVHTAGVGGGSSSASTNGIAIEGSTDAGSNLQPYIVMNYIIKL